MTTAVLLLYLDLLLAWEVLSQVRQRYEGEGEPVAKDSRRRKGRRRTQRQPMQDWQWALIYLALVPFAWILVAVWPLTEGWRRRWGLERLPASGDLLLVMGTLAVAQFAAAVQLLPFVGNEGYYTDVNEDALMKVSVLFLIVMSAYVGLLWNVRTWLICGGIFYAIYVLLYTTFFSNMGGFWSGIWGSLDYWLLQQKVERGSQPDYYYLMILPMYEFLPLLFALVAALVYLVRGRLRGMLIALAAVVLVLLLGLAGDQIPLVGSRQAELQFLVVAAAATSLPMDWFTRFLVYWVVAALFAFALAGEKMPWLTVHLAIPIIMLAAKLLGDLFERLSISLPLKWRTPETLVLLAALAGAIAMIMLWGTGFSVVGAALALVIGVMVLPLIVRAWRLYGPLPAAQASAALVAAALMILTLRAAGLAAYDEGDWPNEMLSYADMSPDMPWVRDELVRLGQETGLGLDYPIVVDNQLAWPFAWYLRDFRRVQWASGSMDAPVVGSLVVLDVNNQTWMDPFLDDYESPISIRHLWWFGDGPQYYEGMTFGSFFADLFKASTWDIWRDYFVYREPPWEPPPDDALFYYPRSLEDVGVSVIEAPPPIPTVTAEGYLAIGEAGAGRGQFNLPTGLAVDADGDLYVADSRNNRIQKLDAEGQVLAILGAGGDEEATFNEPWSVAVDKDGNIYVVDTWNHRIQKFDADLNLLSTWGEASSEFDGFFGPRQIAIQADGNVLVVDTGKKRIVRFTSDGEFIDIFGKEGTGPGEFNEPVGIAIGLNGDIYVADTWNRRVQVFDSQFQYLREFSVIGWGSEHPTAKPYLTVLLDGRVILSNPVNGRIELYDQEGNAVAAWDLPALPDGSKARPIGVVVSGQGFLFVSDCWGNKIYRLPLTDLVGP